MRIFDLDITRNGNISVTEILDDKCKIWIYNSPIITRNLYCSSAFDMIRYKETAKLTFLHVYIDPYTHSHTHTYIYVYITICIGSISQLKSK